MRIKYHYCLKKEKRLLDFLNKYQLSYEINDLLQINYSSCIFDLYEDQDIYGKFKVQYPFISRFDSIKTIEYSKDEIENAEWLSVRSKGTKVEWEYTEDAFRKSCPYKRPLSKEMYYRHSEQIALLSAGKSVQWGKRQFFSGPNAVDDIIFCSERAKMILQDRWENLEFWPVKKYNTSNYITGVYQLFFSECLPVEAFKGGHPTTCSKCGRKMIRITKGIQQLEISRKYFQNSNSVYRTGDILTEQFIGYATFSLNIVSQEFYQYCEANQMNRGMIYEPIKLI